MPELNNYVSVKSGEYLYLPDIMVAPLYCLDVNDKILDEFSIQKDNTPGTFFVDRWCAKCLYCGEIIDVAFGGVYHNSFKGDASLEGKRELFQHLRNCNAFFSGKEKIEVTGKETQKDYKVIAHNSSFPNNR